VPKLKVIGIDIDSHNGMEINGEKCTDFLLIIFKTPVFLRTGMKEMLLSRNCGVILSGNQPQFIRSADKGQILTDSIRFRLTPSDLQYVEALGIPLNKPFQLGETIVIRDILRCMSVQSFTSEKLKGDFLESALKMLLINISSQLSDDNADDILNIPHYLRLKQLRRSIYEKPSKRWNIDEICDEMNISKTYFHRIYSAAFGVTCMKDVIDSRISHAQALLRDTALSVSLIAEQCGYDSDSYFMRQFKQNIGCTPTEYRRRAAK